MVDELEVVFNELEVVVALRDDDEHDDLWSVLIIKFCLEHIQLLYEHDEWLDCGNIQTLMIVDTHIEKIVVLIE